MNRVNFRFLFVTVVCVVALAAIVHAIHISQYGKHVGAWKRLADDAKAANNKPQQIDYLRRYTSLDKTNAAALEELGGLLIESNRFQEAQLPLATALTSYQDEHKTEDVERIRRDLVNVALRSGRWTDAEVQLKQLIDEGLDPKTESPTQAEYREQRAKCRLALGQWAEAEEQLKLAIQHDVTRCDSHGLLAEVQISKLDKPREAIQQLKAMVDANPDSADAHRIRLAFRLRNLDNEAARRAEAELLNPPADPAARPEPLSQAEVLTLAALDAQASLEHAEQDDLAVVELAMQCAHLQIEADGDEQRPQHLADAKQHAEGVIALVQSRSESRIEEFREGFIASRKPADPQDPKFSEQDQAILDEVTARIERETYQQAITAYNILADIALKRGQTAAAIGILADGLEKVKFDETLLLNLTSLKMSQRQTGEDDSVERLLKVLGGQNASLPLSRFLTARKQIGLGKWRVAMNELISLKPQLQRWPSTILEADLGIATCLVQLGRHAEAETIYRRLLEANPDSTSVHWGLAQALEVRHKAGEAYQHYARVAQALPPDAAAGDMVFRIIRAMIAWKVAEQREASALDPGVKLIADMRAGLARSGEPVDSRTLDMLDVLEAQLLVARDEEQAAETLLKNALQRNPQSSDCWLELIRLYQWRRDWDVALQTLQQARLTVGAADPVDVAEFNLTEAIHHVLKFGAALAAETPEAVAVSPAEITAQVLSLLNSCPQPVPENRESLQRYLEIKVRFAQICMTLGDEDNCQRLYDEISAQDPTNVQARSARMELALRRQDLDQLKKVLDEAESIDGRESPMWKYCEAARLALGPDGESLRANLNNAERLLLQVESAGAGQSQLRRLRSIILRRQLRLSAAVDIDMQTYRESQVSPQFITQLVQDLYRLKRIDEAAEILGSGRVRPEDAPNPLALVPTALDVAGVVQDQEQSRNLQSLAVDLARVAAAKSLDAPGKLAYGLTLLRAGKVDEARVEFTAARDLDPTAPDPWLLLIELDARNNQLDQARQTAEQAAQAIRPADRAFALARAYDLVQDFERSREFLDQALAEIPQDLTQATPLQIEILQRAAESYFVHAQRTAQEAEKVAKTTPETAQQQVAVAKQFEQTGLKLLNRLVTDGSRALAALDVSAAGAAAPTTAAANDGLRLQLVNILPIARRRLALTYLAQSGADNRQHALRLIEENGYKGYAEEDSRLRAIILSQSPEVADREQALTTIRTVIKQSQKPHEEDQLLAGTLLLAEYRRLTAQAMPLKGEEQKAERQAAEAAARVNLSEARELFNAIVLNGSAAMNAGGSSAKSTPSPSFVQALVGYIEILMANREIAEAVDSVQLLLKSAPGLPLTVATASTVYFENKDDAAAIDIIRRFAVEGPEEYRNRRSVAAVQLLESLGRRTTDSPRTTAYLDAAEPLLTGPAESDQGVRLVLAGFRARRGNAADAIDLITAESPTATDVQLTSAAVHAMKAAGLDVELQHRLIAALNTSLSTHPDSIPLKLMLADLHTWLGEAESGEQLYREVVLANPNHAAAVNNLAFLLASQRRNLDESLALINSLIENQGALAELVDTRAYIYLQRGEAAKTVTELAALSENAQPTYLFHQAQALLALNRIDEAKVAWTRAAELGLTEALLHPLERADFQKAAAQLAPLQPVTKTNENPAQ